MWAGWCPSQTTKTKNRPDIREAVGSLSQAGSQFPDKGKKIMKTINTSCALLGAALLTASSAFGSITGTGTLLATDNLGSLGYFNAQSVSTTIGPNLGSFKTFCLNRNVGAPITGQVYGYTLSDNAFPGYANPNPVAIGTAWLYSQFVFNTLSTHVAAFNGTYNANYSVQDAIWWFQGDSTFNYSAANNDYVKQAEIAVFGFSGGIYDTLIKTTPANSAYGVVAVDLNAANQPAAQPLLAVVPEPSTIVAGALLVLPFGISGLRILRRNQQVQ